jgi:hypothetical protein
VARTVRLRNPVTPPEVAERSRRAADVLRPYIGQFVARKDERVLIAAARQPEVFGWLREHGERDAVVFMVPVDPVAATSFT